MKTCKQCSLCAANNVCDLRITPNSGRCVVFIDTMEALKPSHNNARDEILCDFPTGCGMRSNGRCDLADPCDKYIPHKTSPVA